MRPRHDLPSDPERVRMRRAAQQDLLARMARRFPNLRNRRRGRGADGEEGVPADPNRPSHLTGGAAAALDFDEG